MIMIARHLIGMLAATAFATAPVMAETVTLKLNQTTRVEAELENSGSAPSEMSGLGIKRDRVGFRDIRRRQIDIVGQLGYICGMSPLIPCDFCLEKRMTGYERWNRKSLIAQDKAMREDTFTELAAHYHRLTGQDRA